MAQACRHSAGRRCSGSVRGYRRQRAPRPSLSVWCPRPCTPVSPSAHSSPTPPPPRDYRAHAQAASPTLQRAQDSAGHHQEHPHPCRSPRPPKRAPPIASPPQKPFFSSSNSGQNPQPRPYTPNCSPLAKPAGSDIHPEPTCPHLCAPHHPGPGMQMGASTGSPHLGPRPSIGPPHTAPKETAVRSDPISVTQIHLPVAPHFTPSE